MFSAEIYENLICLSQSSLLLFNIINLFAQLFQFTASEIKALCWVQSEKLGEKMEKAKKIQFMGLVSL